MRNRMLFWLLLGGGAFVLLTVVALALLLAYGGDSSGDFAFGNRIQVVDVEGELVDSRPIIEQLKRYEDSKSVPAILLNVDSPGGGVAASQEIYTEIKRLREKKHKIVVAYMSSVGASGAYYVSCPADKIIANSGTIVGSIGVIAEWVNYGDLLQWAKLKDVTFKTGEFKDTGSPTRALTDREKAYFQGLIDDMYVEFVDAVAAGRKLDVEAVRVLADGRVFTGRDAREKKLIDEIGNFQDAVDLTASLAGITGKPNLLRATRQRVTLIDLLTGDVSRLNPFGAQTLKSQVRFQYLWK
ncbi:MAG TPA: signal peptide peptidase SppA [Terriglobia bacterium]|jgi:protease-4|nr:signal peptide peptidase SppA [Terriglobia bacterium]